jgi:cytochrome c biogenesis factor
MIVETGHYALVLALALALVNSVLPVWGSVTRDQRLMAVAPPVGFEPGLTESESFRIRLQSSSTTHRFGPIAERHGPADPEPFALRGCDLVTHALAVVAKSACES